MSYRAFNCTTETKFVMRKLKTERDNKRINANIFILQAALKACSTKNMCLIINSNNNPNCHGNGKPFFNFAKLSPLAERPKHLCDVVTGTSNINITRHNMLADDHAEMSV